MLSEQHIIHTLQAASSGFIGDDAAVLPYDDQNSFVFTKDLLIENTHFNLSYQDPDSLAHKAIHVNLSDLAAMGAEPKYLMLGLSIPDNFKDKVDHFLMAFQAVTKANGVILIGGDTTLSKHGLVISITAIGIAKTEHVQYRSTAKPTDILCGIGYLGFAHIGWKALEQNHNGLTYFKHHFLKPNALISEGKWLSDAIAVTSMMDISDGLYIDALKLGQASQVDVDIWIENLIFIAQRDEHFEQSCKTLSLNLIETMLFGGEDYGLLFTVKQNLLDRLSEQYQSKFSTPFHILGQCIQPQDKPTITLLESGKPFHLDVKPFLHFGELLF